MKQLLEVNGLTKSFGGVQAVQGLDFAIEEGRCVALLGPNGAGKTTTIRMLTGLLSPTSGSVTFHGVKSGEERKKLLGYLPQAPAFYNWMSGLEYVIYAGRLYGLSSSESKLRAKELMDRVGLGDAAKRRIRGYSGGMKQRLGLAQALLHRPRLLVMDEPVSALDPIGRREVLGLLRELKQETTVLFSTHVLHDAEELCDDVIIIRSGQVALQGSLSDIRNEHRRPIIELRLEGDKSSALWLRTFMERVRSEEADNAGNNRLFQDIEQHGDVVRITVADVDAARQTLLEQLAKERVKLNRLSVGYSSLEELFMKVVSV